MPMALKNLTILLVEDELDSSNELLYTLKPLFKKVIVATNGLEGKELFFQYLPDLILTDIRMPILDGLTMIEEIHKDFPNIPVIILTAYNEIPYLFKSMELKIDDYILKPVNLQDLIEALKKAAYFINLV